MLNPMKLVVPEEALDKKNPIKRLKLFEKRSELVLGPATVLTGANGSGKTSIINAIAAGLGLCDQYSTRTVSQSVQVHHIDLAHVMELYGLLKTDQNFDEVFCYRGDQGGRTPIALDAMEDVMAIFDSKGSHGEVNLAKFAKHILVPAKSLIDNGKFVLLLMDEPECGFSPEYIIDLCIFLVNAIGKAKLDFAPSLNMVLTTQNPLVLYTALDAGATRIDLGGWKKKDPFVRQFNLLKGLIEGLEKKGIEL